MAHYKLKAIGGVNEHCYSRRGYQSYTDERGNWYSGWAGEGEKTLLTTLARHNEWNERDMPIFTKEFCEYLGYKREKYDTVEFI